MQVSQYLAWIIPLLSILQGTLVLHIAISTMFVKLTILESNMTAELSRLYMWIPWSNEQTFIQNLWILLNSWNVGSITYIAPNDTPQTYRRALKRTVRYVELCMVSVVRSTECNVWSVPGPLVTDRSGFDTQQRITIQRISTWYPRWECKNNVRQCEYAERRKQATGLHKNLEWTSDGSIQEELHHPTYCCNGQCGDG